MQLFQIIIIEIQNLPCIFVCKFKWFRPSKKRIHSHSYKNMRSDFCVCVKSYFTFHYVLWQCTVDFVCLPLSPSSHTVQMVLLLVNGVKIRNKKKRETYKRPIHSWISHHFCFHSTQTPRCPLIRKYAHIVVYAHITVADRLWAGI